MTSTLRHSGAQLQWQLHGERGESLLLIQGVGVCGSGWQPQVRELSSRFRMLTFDNRGIGQSILEPGAPFSVEQMADDARALMDAAGWERCHVAGHSMGGVIAQCLGLKNPNRVKSLMLLCTVARGADAVRMTPRILWTAIRTHVGSRASRRRAFLELIYPSEDLTKARVPELAAELAPLFGHDLAEQPPIAMRQAMALRRYDARPTLVQLGSIPTLVISAERDPIAPPRFGRELARLIPGARYREISGASHGLPIQRSEEINAQMAAFMESAI